MKAGTKTILKVVGITVGGAFLGAVASELGKAGIEKLRYDVRSDVEKDADGRITEYWKTWTPKTKK
jgi:hypothetical protein